MASGVSEVIEEVDRWFDVLVFEFIHDQATSYTIINGNVDRYGRKLELYIHFHPGNLIQIMQTPGTQKIMIMHRQTIYIQFCFVAVFGIAFCNFRKYYSIYHVLETFNICLAPIRTIVALINPFNLFIAQCSMIYECTALHCLISRIVFSVHPKPTIAVSCKFIGFYDLF